MRYIFGGRRRILNPAGIIIPFDDTSIPTDWERFTSADSKHIVGAGDTYAVGATGGAQASISKSTSTAGAHTGSTDPVSFIRNTGASEVPSYPSYRSIESGGSASAGDHNHTLTAKYDTAYQQIVLIRATNNFVKFPENAIVFGATGVSPVTGLDIAYDDDILLRSGASITTGGGAFSTLVCGYGPDDNYSGSEHFHETLGQYYNPTGATTGYSYYDSPDASVHTFTPTLDDQTLKRAYLAAWKGSSAFFGASGVIAMWEGSTAPHGWKLATWLQDYFIEFGTALTAGDTYDEANAIDVSFSIDNDTWNHGHLAQVYNNIEVTGVVSGWHSDTNATHGHTAANYTGAYTPPYYALTFIEKL